MRRILALILSVAVVLAMPCLAFAASGSSASQHSSFDVDSSTTATDTTQTLSDGTKVETETAADGTVTTTTTKPDGEESVNVDVSTKAVADSGSDDPVVIDIDVTAVPSEDADEAAEVTIKMPASAKDKLVEVTVTNMAPGVVPAKVNADGSLEIVKDATIGENGGVVFVPEAGATYVFVENQKAFNDVTGSEEKNAADFVSARELMVGTGEGTFTPNKEITPAMVATVLARLDNAVETEDTTGADWENAGINWAERAGYDVSDSDEPMSRIDLMVMMYKFAGSPAVEGNALANYTDAGDLSGDALAAANWCVSTGLIKGTSATTLDSDATTNRIQFALVLERYCTLL